MWFPYIHQIQVRRNKSYFNSLFIGLTAPIFNIWSVLALTILLPMIRGLIAALKVLIWVPIMGVTGNLTAENITVEQAYLIAMKRAQEKAKGNV